MQTCVYKVTNLTNGKVYYGKAVDVEKRWYQHLWDTSHGSDLVFHRAIRKHGAHQFHREVVGTHPTDEAANAHEIALIATVPLGQGYNVAPGGNGGRTMSPEQIEAQYGVPSARRGEFTAIYASGMSLADMAKHFGTTFSSVQRTIRRWGLTPRGRNPPRNGKPHKTRRVTRCAKLPGNIRCKSRVARPAKGAPPPKAPKPLSTPRDTELPPSPKAPKAPKPRLTPEEVKARQIASNIARGTPKATQDEILRLYLVEHMAAKDIAPILGVTKGSVRATVTRH